MSVDMDKVREITDRVEELDRDGKLTKDEFQKAWRELVEVLGDGPEAEGIEALSTYARRGWTPEDE